MSRALATLLGRRNPLRRRRTSGVGPRLTYPDAPLGIRVALALGADPAANPSTWTWTDITAYVMYGEEGGIIIRRGRADEQTQTPPSWCRLQVNNADGRFSRLNPTGAYYGQLNKNTPLRVQVNPGTGWATRFVGFVSEWPPRWTHGGRHHWVPIQADGILRRLGQGTYQRSPLTRIGHLGRAGTGVLRGWWPLEAGQGAVTSTPSGMTNGAAATVASASPGQPVFTTSADGLPGASGALDLSGGATLAGPLQHGTPTGPWRFECALKISDQTVGNRIALYGTNGAPYLGLFTTNTDTITIFLQSGATTDTLTGTATLADGQWHWVSITLTGEIFGVSVAAVTLHIDNVEVTLSGTETITSAEIASFAVSNVDTASQIFYWRYIGTDPPASPELAAIAAQAYAGDQAHERIERLMDQDGYPLVMTGTESAEMGPQPTDGLLPILRESEAADSGLIYEALTGELAYRTYPQRLNLPAALALDHDRGHIVAPFEPTDDDLLTRNDVTVTRVNGGSATATDEDSIAAVGRYDEQLTLNLHTDGQAIHHAGWLVHVGTVDELRYPTVVMQLRKSPDLVRAWLACDVGSRVTIANLPAGVTPNVVDQVIEGYTEHISSVVWAVSFG